MQSSAKGVVSCVDVYKRRDGEGNCGKAHEKLSTKHRELQRVCRGRPGPKLATRTADLS